MKKVLLFLAIALLLTGCDSKVTTVTNPNGDSKTYQFFINADYTPEVYTLKLKNDETDITIINDQNRNYYRLKNQSEVTEIIEKDSMKYTISKATKTYTEEPITLLDDYGLGYLPADMEVLKTQSYKTGKEWHGLTRYTFEEYDYEGGTTTYYFKGDKLKYIKNKTALEENTVEFISINNKVKDNQFDLPDNYQAITY